jgi:Domain of unknown function (DUF4375)
MSLYHHITVFSVSESEKARLLEAGVTFTNVTKGSRGEAVTFDIGEDHPNWKQIAELIASLSGDFRSQDLTMLRPTFEESAKASLERVSKHNPGWLNGYSGQTVEELIALEGKYRIDSLVTAFEQAILQKAERGDKLTAEERIVLAVEALEREVNNGGYDQFFVNSPSSASGIVAALQRIGCVKTASITQNAIETLGATDLTEEGIEAAVYSVTSERGERFKSCDDAYYQSAEPIADRLFALIKENRLKISL